MMFPNILNLLNFKPKLSYWLKPWRYCNMCGIPNFNLICNYCYTELEKVPLNCCKYCQKPFSYLNQKACNECSFKRPYFDRVFCQFSYTPPLSKMLHSLKYQANIQYAKALGQIFATVITQMPRKADVIIPMPLHHDRLLERKFNQMDLILSYYQTIYHQIPINHELVSRIKNTPPQALTSKASRITNLSNAFTLHGQVTNLHIIIADDVITTGATANELAKLFKQQGAKQVDVCCLMRTI